MEDDEFLMKLSTDRIKLNLPCVAFLEQSGWSYASNVSSTARPVPEQLKFKSEALQLLWFSFPTS